MFRRLFLSVEYWSEKDRNESKDEWKHRRYSVIRLFLSFFFRTPIFREYRELRSDDTFIDVIECEVIVTFI